MMLRLSLAARLTMIVLIGLTVVWIVAIALFYRAQAPARDSATPPPARIAALAALIETMPAAGRPLALAAVASNSFEARLEPAGALAGAGGSPADAALRATYADALGGRALMVTRSARLSGEPLFPRLYRMVATALEFRIGLRTGETLVIDTWSVPAASRLGVPVGFGAGLFGTVVALIALLILHRETRPLARLAAAADRIDLSGTRVTLPGGRTSAPEIRALIAAFDRLQTRLNQLLRARMAMLGGISHDVRSFAARLRLRVEHIPDPSERARAIGDIADMIRLLDDALLASRAGVGELAEELLEFDALVRIEVEDRRASGADVTLNALADAPASTVLGDRLALRRVVENLVANAIAYGHAAHLRLTREDGMVRLDVDDNGPGIPPAHREVLLEPFVRLERSRNRSTGGAGLGLAVVSSLVDAHRGRVEITNAPGGGARVTVWLPLFRAESA